MLFTSPLYFSDVSETPLVIIKRPRCHSVYNCKVECTLKLVPNNTILKIHEPKTICYLYQMFNYVFALNILLVYFLILFYILFLILRVDFMRSDQEHRPKLLFSAIILKSSVYLAHIVVCYANLDRSNFYSTVRLTVPQQTNYSNTNNNIARYCPKWHIKQTVGHAKWKYAAFIIPSSAHICSHGLDDNLYILYILYR